MSTQEDFEDDIEGGNPDAPPPSANGAAAPRPRVPRARVRGGEKGESHTQEARGGIGIGRVPSTGVKGLDKPFENTDAEFLWPEVLERLRENGRSEYQCQIRVERIAPGDKVTLGTFECSSVVGDESINPGDALYRRVVDEFHLQYSQWPATYNIIFIWKINGQMLTRGRLSLPAPMLIRQQRENEERKLAAQAAPVAGYGAPPIPHAPMPVHYPAYTAPVAGESPEVTRLRDELRRAQEREERLMGVNDEIRRAAAEGREPRIPAGYGAPVDPMAALEERLSRTLESGLMQIANALSGGRVGLGQQAPAPPVYQAPPPPPPPPPAPVDPLVAMSQKLTQKMLERTLERVATSMERSMDAIDAAATGLGAPEPDVALAPVTPPPEEDFKTWKGTKSDFGTWSDGRPVIFPAKKDGGGIDPIGAVFENPIIAETLMGGLNNLMEATTDAIKKVASGESPHVRRVGPVQAPPQQLPPQGSPPPSGNGFDE